MDISFEIKIWDAFCFSTIQDYGGTSTKPQNKKCPIWLGGEYKPFTTFLSNHGITHRLICPHTHHQNGVVERKHRHIVELGLTLLHHPFLPLAF